MSCDAAASAAYLLFAAFSPAHMTPVVDRTPAVATAPGVNPLSREPLFADIVSRSKRLKADVEGFEKGLAGGATIESLPRFAAFKAEIAALSALDMKGHLELAARGADSDLKCILRGISQDLPKKLEEMTAAKDAAARSLAAREMAYLLNDNVEVITSPPAPPV